MASDTDLLDQIRSAADLGSLDQLRVSVLGKSGSITQQLKALGSMDPDTRAAEAPKIHAFRELITSAIADRKSALENAELERKLAGVAIQGTMARWGEVSLLAFDPAKGSAGLVDLSAATDVKLVRLASRSWMPER